MTFEEFKNEVERGLYNLEEIARIGQDVSDNSGLSKLCQVFLDNIEDIENEFYENLCDFDIDISLE